MRPTPRLRILEVGAGSGTISATPPTFDVTHCHQVLTHLPRPADALREILRVTRAGGVVVAREGDLETECVWPELPGMTPKAGRQLLS